MKYLNTGSLKTIVVAGAHSSTGKTLLAEEILRALPDYSALKITVKKGSRCPRRDGCQVCSRFKGDFDIITDRKLINEKGTDTARLKKAGAKKVVWLKATSKGLKAGFKKALGQFKGSKGIVIEGTSILRHIKPDAAIYIKDNNKNLRSAAKIAKEKADIIIDVNR